MTPIEYLRLLMRIDILVFALTLGIFIGFVLTIILGVHP